MLAGAVLCGSVWASEPVRVVLGWVDQAQFAGHYMAMDKGFYAEAGLDVTIVPGGPDVVPLDLLRSGEADFATVMLSAAIGTQDDLRLLAQVVNRSNFMLVAWRNGRDGSRLIEQPSDLNGCRITLWPGFRPPYDSFLAQQQVQAEVLPQYETLSLFLYRGADACSAMTYNGYHQLVQNAVPPEEMISFTLADYGIVLAEDGLYALRETCRNNPEMCRAFAEATLKGWSYARDHREEALDAVMKRVEKAHSRLNNRSHMNWMLDTILESIFPQSDDDWVFGELTQQHYLQSARALGISRTTADYQALTGGDDGKD